MAGTNRFVYWTPRVLAILLILFVSVFSFDVFDEGYTFWQTVLALFLHNIPSLVLLIVLIISWKHEIVGGVAFILTGLLYIMLALLTKRFEWYILFGIAFISGPAFIVGILFLINWFGKKVNKYFTVVGSSSLRHIVKFFIKIDQNRLIYQRDLPRYYKERVFKNVNLPFKTAVL